MGREIVGAKANPNGRPNVLNTLLETCNLCASQIKIDILQSTSTYAQSRCKGCGVKVIYPTKFCFEQRGKVTPKDDISLSPLSATPGIRRISND